MTLNPNYFRVSAKTFALFWC